MTLLAMARTSCPSRLVKLLRSFGRRTTVSFGVINHLLVRGHELTSADSTDRVGWWLGKTDHSQAWVPAAYVEELVRPPPPPPNAKSKPPAPPAKRVSAVGRKPIELQQRDSGMSLNGTNSADHSKSNTQQPSSLGESLADALLARKNATRPRRDDDDDW